MRMAAMMSRALAFSPLAIGEEGGSEEVDAGGSGESGDWAIAVLAAADATISAAAGGFGSSLAGLAVKESKSVFCRDAFRRATYDGDG